MAAEPRGLTPQQARAISAQSVSVGLSAGAGCGKTFVLTERFLAALTAAAAGPPTAEDLRRLVAITFTERAAREMRQRVRGACRQRLREAPAEHADAWLALVRQLDTARISTIHSFCTTLLRTHAVEAGLEPQFTVLSQAQADTLLVGVVQEELHRRLVDGDADVLELAVQFGLQRLWPLVHEMLGCRAEIDWEHWARVTPDELAALWQRGWKEDLQPRLLAKIAGCEPAQTLLRTIAAGMPSHPVMRERCRMLLERLPKLGTVPIFAAGGRENGTVPFQAELDAIRENAKVQGGGRAKDWPSAEAYEAFKTAAQQLRDAIDDCRDKCDFSPETARPAAQNALQLLAVTRIVCERYEARKRELSALDFDDLLLRTRQLLRGEHGKSICRSFAGQLRLLLVDEFQDTDPLQVEIVEALCGESVRGGKLFFVGDSKQSIYRFRGADPHVFRRLRQSLSEEGRLSLTKNFRSQPAILDFVNALFCAGLGPDYEALEADRCQVTPPPAVEFLWAVGDENEEAQKVQALRRREAQWIARRLRSLFDAGAEIVYDAAAGRPAARSVEPGDVAILFRALSDVAYYEEALREYGIDYYLVGGHAFYAQQEVFDLLNLLRAVENAGDDLSLAGVLRSGFFNLTDETLFWLGQHPDGLGGGLAADPLSAQIERAQRGRVSFAASVLSQLRGMKNSVPISQLIHEALSRTGYDALLVAEFLGPRKLANLHKLIEQAREFDASGIFGLADFITQLSEFVARQPDEPLAATSTEAGNVVRLMTVHQAKGLEFPVVVVPDLDRPRRRSTTGAAFSRQWGPVVRTDKPGGFELYAQAEGEEEAAELARLFYVATTRAADYLILASGVSQLETARGPWMQLLAGRFDLQTGAVRGQLPQGYRVPQIRVIAAEPEAIKPRGTSIRRDLGQMAEKAAELADKDAGHVPPHLGTIAADLSARRQYSFSRLSGALRVRPIEPVAADGEEHAAAEPSVDPLGLGTLVHAVLAEVDFAGSAGASLAELVGRHAQRHVPAKPQAADEAAAMIERFLQSPRAEAIRSAAEVHRELEFLLAWDGDNELASTSPLPLGEGQGVRAAAASEQNGALTLTLSRPSDAWCPERGDSGAARSPYFQGYFDCLYRDSAGGWHLIDYKTNRLDRRTPQEVAADYELQMFLYAQAAQRVLGVMPVELVLHFLRSGEEHCFRWNQAAQRKLAAQVDKALSTARSGAASTVD